MRVNPRLSRLVAWVAAGVAIIGAPVLATVTPFIDAAGLLTPGLRLGTLVAYLGEPPASEVWPEVRDGGQTHGGELLHAYPALGLAFRIERAQRPARDPAISALYVRAPWSGLPANRVWPALSLVKAPVPPMPAPRPEESSRPHLGMDGATLQAMAAARYRVVEQRLQNGSGSLTLAAAADRRSPPRRTLIVYLRDDHVVGLDFRDDATSAISGPVARALRWTAAALIVLLALATHVLLPRLLPRLVARARAIDEAQPTMRGASLWPMRLVGLVLLGIGGWLLASQVGWQYVSSSAITSFQGPLVGFAGAVLMVLGALLVFVRRLRYQPMNQFVGTLWVAALVAAAWVGGLLPQWPL